MSKKAKFTKEDLLQIRNISLRMPIFPKCDSMGDPILYKRKVSGKEILRIWHTLKFNGKTDKLKKQINIGQMYNLEGWEDHNTDQIIKKALSSGLGPDHMEKVIKDHLALWEIYTTRLLSNNTKMIQDKNINHENEKSKSLRPPTDGDATVIDDNL